MSCNVWIALISVYSLYSSQGISLPTLRSGLFKVGVGAPSNIVQDASHLMSSVIIMAGEYLRVTPKLTLFDDGGNVVASDSTSRINIILDSNPSGSVLLPLTSKSAIARSGVVIFSALKMDKVGLNYRFKYVLSTYSSLNQSFTETAVVSYSEFFNVDFGPPRIIDVAVHPTKAIAGGQAFGVQPKLQLLDYGSNVLVTDYSSTAVCSIVESLSTSAKARIVDTRYSTILNIVDSVTLNVVNGTYGKGQLIEFFVNFKFQIYLVGPSIPTPLPYLALNIVTASGRVAEAVLYGSYSGVSVLSFYYNIAEGDTTSALDYGSTTSLNLNTTGIKFVDGINRTVSLLLPSRGLSYHTKVIIDTGSPVVVGFSTSTPDGVYAAGEVIYFNVTYDHSIQVTGVPYLLLTSLAGNTSTYGSLNAKAYFVNINSLGDSRTLVFQYNVRLDDHTLPSQNLTVLNSTIQIPAGAKIQRLSNVLSTGTVANNSLDLFTAAFALAHEIEIDKTGPTIDLSYGIRTSHINGTFYPGEKIYVTLRFSKPVVALGASINIYLQTGSPANPLNGIALLVSVLPDEVTLLFEYIVVPATNTTRLDIIDNGAALFVGGANTYIRRKATVPTLDANISTAAVYHSGNSLGQNSNIQLNGFQPIVTKVTIIQVVQAFPGKYLYPDDIVIIRLTYSTRVLSVCSPVLLIDAGTFTREAPLISGNQTQYLDFRYTVETGDKNPNGIKLSYSNPPPFCSTSGCSKFPSYCGIFANATTSQYAADLGIPYTIGRQATGITVPKGNYSILPHSLTRNTSVLSVSSRLSSGSYGPGTLVYIDVLFNDVAVIYAEPYPTLYLNIGKYATYASGFSTPTVSFLYITESDDSIAVLMPMNVPNTSSIIRCLSTESCSVTNAVNGYVNLSISSSIVHFSTIALDATVANITRVYSSLVTSPYGGYYTIGQIVDIHVVFSRPVVVVGTTARIKMDCGALRYAYYQPLLSTSLDLIFELVVQEGDESVNLAYTGSSIDLVSGTTTITRQADVPSSPADLTLPGGSRLVAINGNIITLDTTLARLPHITSVNTVSPNATYRAGDSIMLRVIYSHYIVMTGRGFLSLNMGTQIGVATFVGVTAAEAVMNIGNYTTVSIPTAATLELFFHYDIAPGDISIDLDYTDIYAFSPGLDEFSQRGSILLSLNAPSTFISTALPVPGTSGSLSATSELYIDGGPAYLTGLSFVSPPGMYSIGDVIHIRMNLSAAAIVTGVPYLVLSTGGEQTATRNAVYTSGSGSTNIIFTYVPQPGDYSINLDYKGDAENLNSALASFQLNGGSILVASTAPIVPVSIILSPPSGNLTGQLSIVAAGGSFTFMDLAIDAPGLDYYLRFSAAIYTGHRLLTTTTTLFVSFSAQFAVRPPGAFNGDRVCQSVAVSGTMAVCGAPNTNMGVTPIQSVTLVVAPGSVATSEIQIFSTTIVPRKAVQQFHTTVGIGATVGGSFSIKFGSLGPSDPIPANAGPDMLKAILTTSIPAVGDIDVTREEYIFCACFNAFTWTITFNDYSTGVMPTVVFDYSSLSGTNAQLIGPTIIQTPATLGGFFALQIMTSTGLKQSTFVPYDASGAQVATALQQIALTADVTSNFPDASGTRLWTITFGEYLGGYYVPLLSVNTTKLTGGVAGAWAQIARPGVLGPGGVTGGFALEFRGNTTTIMSSNVSAAGMKAALEALPVIDKVNVLRSAVTGQGQYTWTIEFVQVSLFTAYGYMVQPTRSIESIIAHNYLLGDAASILVLPDNSPGASERTSGPERAGSYGPDAGVAYVYSQLPNGKWLQVNELRGADTAGGNFFGSSVALQGSVMLVGAIAGSNNGLPEIQSVFCSADAGFFQLTFRGWTTPLLGVSTTRAELTAAIISDPKTFSHLYSITSISIKDWGPGGLCDNNTAVITFYSPSNGDYPFFGVDDGPDMELLGVELQSLRYANSAPGVVVVSEVQKATRIVNTINADTQQEGVAYLFNEADGCSGTSNSTCLAGSMWTEEIKFAPLEATGMERFGTSVALDSVISVVGSPGSKNESGVVYVYVYSTINNVTSWTLLQQLSALTTVSGDNFGHCVAVQSRTLVVGAPYGSEGTGSVYVFRSSRVGQPYGSEQLLIPAASSHVLSIGNLFGWSVAISGDIVVVGAPEADDNTIYLGSIKAAEARLQSGAVFVFHRISPVFKFLYLQKLVGANVRRLDRLGWSVDVKGTTILVGAVEKFGGTLGPSRAITEVTTQCNIGSRVGSTFKLEWGGRKSKDISYDASAVTIATVLETVLLTGPVLVSRSDANAFTGGYKWTVTFLELDYLFNGYDFSPALVADSTALTGYNASVLINVTFSNNLQLRGKSHVFQRNEVAYGSLFVEQLYLNSYVYQPADQCGYSVALVDDYYAFIGCPNRDGVVPNSNYGGGIFFNLTLLRVRFDNYNYSVLEGGNITVSVRRVSDAAIGVNDAMLYVQTLDRNAPVDDQLFASHMYNMLESEISYYNTALDASGLVGKAVGRSQYYGSTQNQSSWIHGMYDYRGISDYVPFKDPIVLAKAQSSISVELITNRDDILEAPDEKVTLVISSPGLWPSILGRFYTSVTLLNADGHDEYSKVYDNTAEAGAEFGHAVAVISALQVMFSSAPLANVGLCVKCGKLSLHKYSNGVWAPQGMLSSPTPTSGSFYGDDVVAAYNINQGISLLVVGEPGTSAVHVYLSQNTTVGSNYTLEVTLNVSEVHLPQHRFGTKGSIALTGSLLIVGAPGLEAIYAFRRIYSNSTGMGWVWTAGERLRSSDFDYDFIGSIVTLHAMNFGKSTAASGRSIAVGAPFADYDRLGSVLVEVDVDTQGQDIFGFGRGKVYVFSSSPAVQLITLDAVQPLSAGQFRLEYTGFGTVETTRYLNFNMSVELMVSALEALSNIDVVAVSMEKDVVIVGGFRTTWSVTFMDMWQEPQVLVPLWHNFGCPSCTPFEFNSTVPSKQIQVSVTSSMGLILEDQALSANDARNGNRFGWSVALDGHQLAVGAVFSAAATTTTWDFEAGTLKGWTATGTAFAFQPTFGDNSRYRITERISQTSQQGSTGESSRMRGLYYIGTFEMRPGNTTDYTIANTLYTAGSSQGNAPQGVLTSDVFIIYGSTISFLLGGGCDYYTVYVELLIDGLSVSKLTGKCEERMRRVSFDVSFLQLRAAQIRIVDASSGIWGHINVDEITFSWDVHGATVNATTIQSPGYNGKDTAGGMIDTPHSGAAYTFLRHVTGSYDLCELNTSVCSWVQEAQLFASDKRANAMFGDSLAVNDVAGILVVSAPKAAFTGYYREVQSVYPYHNAELEFPVSSSLAPLFEGLAMYTPEASGAYGYWYLQQQRGIVNDPQPFEDAGAIYVYAKDRAVLSNTGSVAVPQQWQTTELIKMQPPDEYARDFFGSSIALDGHLLAIGAVGQDGAAVDAGAVYLYNTYCAAIKFAKVSQFCSYLVVFLLQVSQASSSVPPNFYQPFI